MLNFVVSFLSMVLVITGTIMLVWMFFNIQDQKKLASFSACFAFFYKDVKNFFSKRKEDADDANIRSSRAEMKQNPPTKDETPASKPATLHQMQMDDLREEAEVVRLKRENAAGLKQAVDDLLYAAKGERGLVVNYLSNPQFHNDALRHRRCVKAVNLEIAEAVKTEAEAFRQMAYNDAVLKPQVAEAMLYARVKVAELENKLHNNPEALAIELKQKFENFQPPASSQPAPVPMSAVKSAQKPINGKKINGGRILSAVVN